MMERTTIRTRSCRRRGTAIIEFVLCIPLLVTIIGLTFFFGWAMKNQQHVKMSDRYLTWRQVRNATPDGSDINTAFFEQKASDVAVDGGSGPGETSDDFVRKAGNANSSAGSLAQHVADRSPGSKSTHVGAEFPPRYGLWKNFTGKINSHHSREGVEWRYGQTSCSDAVIQDYLNSLDQTFKALNDPLAEEFRMLYHSGW